MKSSFVISIVLFMQSAIFYAQTERQKFMEDSTKQLYYKHIDTLFLKNYMFISGDSGWLVSQFFYNNDNNFSFSVKAIDQKYCDTTQYFVTRFKYNPKEKNYENIYSIERYSLINGIDTVYDRFESYKTIDRYSESCKISVSYMLNIDKQWANKICEDNCLKLYFYDLSKDVLFEFYYNLNKLNLLHYRKIVFKDMKPYVETEDSVSLPKITQRLWKRYKLKVGFSEVKELSNNYMNAFKKSSVDQYCIIVEFVNNGDICSFMFGDQRPKLYKRGFKQTLFYNILDDLYYPVIYEHGYDL